MSGSDYQSAGISFVDLLGDPPTSFAGSRRQQLGLLFPRQGPKLHDNVEKRVGRSLQQGTDLALRHSNNPGNRQLPKVIPEPPEDHVSVTGRGKFVNQDHATGISCHPTEALDQPWQAERVCNDRFPGKVLRESARQWGRLSDERIQTKTVSDEVQELRGIIC